MSKHDYKGLRPNLPSEHKDKWVIGLDELITIKDHRHKMMDVVARIDTGAEWSSLDKKLFEQLSLSPLFGLRTIKSASGSSKRQSAEATIIMKGRTCTGTFTIADRSRLKYKVLIGQNLLREGFIIDPSIERIIK